MKKTFLAYVGCLTLMVFGQSAAAQTISQVAQVNIINQHRDVIGYASFRSTPRGVLIAVTVSKLSTGWHGLHLHEHANCSGDFQAAGNILKVDMQEHGFFNERGPMNGDLPNLWVNPDGSGRAQFYTDKVTLPDLQSGSAMIISNTIDDMISAPEGDAGERIGCGVIQK